MAPGKNKQAVSFRFEPRTVAELRRRAKRERGGQAGLAERYLKEGMRQDDHPLIHFREAAAGRRAALLGSRLAVADVITTIRQNDNSVDEAAEYLDVPVERVAAALAYYADYRDEIDVEIADAEEIARDEHRRWQRQQEALA